MRTYGRHKKAIQNFYGLYNADEYEPGLIFTDPEFPHDKEALVWEDAGEEYPYPDHLNTPWIRAMDAFGDKSLFGTTGIRPADIRQGSIGNCWFMSAASAIAEYPGRMEKIFLNNVDEVSSVGIYAVNFYTLGVPHTIIVDDYLPLDEKNKTFYAKVGDDGAIWGPILEKAFAKFHGNYNHIIGGDPSMAVRTMTGAPYDKIENSDYENDLDALFAWLKEGDEARDIMTCGTSG